MIIEKYDFNEDRPYIMGILNVTPDSFSDGGLHNTMDTARAATEQMIWGLKWDKDMADIIARHDKACCLMHNRDNINYVNYLDDAIKDLDESVQMAYKAGIDKNKIMVDPGIGFGKTLEQNLIMMNNLELLKKWGLPILLGTSRKSMIGLTLDLPVNEREEGTITTSVIGLMKGCQFFRVHDVKANYRALKMAQAILTA